MAKCHKTKRYFARNLCQRCYLHRYGRAYRGQEKNDFAKKRIPVCHPKRRYSCRGLCHACYSKWRYHNNKDWRKEVLRKSAIYQKENREKVNKYRRAYYKRNKEKYKNWELQRKYGISLGTFKKMLQRQRNRCALCRKKRERFVVDHSHKTGKVRGLLCHRCNGLLGVVEAINGYLKRVASYLARRP